MYEDRIKFFEYKGKRILFEDFSNLSPDQSIEMIAELNKIEKEQPDGSILSLSDFNNFSFSMNVLSAFNKDITEVGKKYKASAYLGIKGLVKVMFDAAAKIMKQESKTFQDKNEALEWLANH